MSQSSAKSELRLSQVITTYGPGAMVDLPTRSVIVGGLDRWEMSARDSWRTIDEPRALFRLVLADAETSTWRMPDRDRGEDPLAVWGRQYYHRS